MCTYQGGDLDKFEKEVESYSELLQNMTECDNTFIYRAPVDGKIKVMFG